LTLSSSNPKDSPLVDPNVLSTKLDRRTIYEPTKLTNWALEGEVGRNMGAEEFGILDDQRRNMSEEAFNKHIERIVVGCCHSGSTCAMGMVINPNCQVYDVDNLRVVDASIFLFR
jgi:choline dehydrogenase-like flavoprotein